MLAHENQRCIARIHVNTILIQIAKRMKATSVNQIIHEMSNVVFALSSWLPMKYNNVKWQPAQSAKNGLNSLYVLNPAAFGQRCIILYAVSESSPAKSPRGIM